MSKKSKLKKLKPRRPFNKEEFFLKRENKQVNLKRELLALAFPDPAERKKYIESLIEGLEKEPNLENKL